MTVIYSVLSLLSLGFLGLVLMFGMIDAIAEKVPLVIGYLSTYWGLIWYVIVKSKPAWKREDAVITYPAQRQQ